MCIRDRLKTLFSVLKATPSTHEVGGEWTWVWWLYTHLEWGTVNRKPEHPDQALPDLGAQVCERSEHFLKSCVSRTFLERGFRKTIVCTKLLFSVALSIPPHTRPVSLVWAENTGFLNSSVGPWPPWLMR